jgi:hypothetical protein
MEVLVKNGVVRLDTPSAPGRNAVYSLHLGVERAAQRGTPDVPNGVREASQQGTPDVPDEVRETYPVVGGRGVETYYKATPNTSRANSKSPLSGTSPGESANDAESPMTYELAAEYLQKISGDFGQAYMQRVTGVEGLKNRVIAAALLAMNENATNATEAS